MVDIEYSIALKAVTQLCDANGGLVGGGCERAIDGRLWGARLVVVDGDRIELILDLWPCRYGVQNTLLIRGLHAVGHSTVIGSVIEYVILVSNAFSILALADS